MDKELLTLLNIIIELLGVIAIVSIISYVLNAIGLYHVLKRQGYKNPWFAWIPILNTLGLCMASQDENGNIRIFGKDMDAGLFTCIQVISPFVLMFIPGIGGVLSLIIHILFMGRVLHITYVRMEGVSENEKKVIAYISSVVSIITVVKFLIYCVKDSKSETLA